MLFSKLRVIQKNDRYLLTCDQKILDKETID
jgi:hypothetical protein